jgi:hypothetical protein
LIIVFGFCGATNLLIINPNKIPEFAIKNSDKEVNATRYFHEYYSIFFIAKRHLSSEWLVICTAFDTPSLCLCYAFAMPRAGAKAQHIRSNAFSAALPLGSKPKANPVPVINQELNSERFSKFLKG